MGRRKRARKGVALVAAVLFAVPWSPARADESGTPFWLSGQYASLAAVPPPPGWSLSTGIYAYSGDAPPGLSTAALTALGTDSRSQLLAIQPTFTPEALVLGGRLSLGLGVGVARVHQELVLSGQEIENETVWGATDLVPVASLAWSHGVHNWLAYLTGNVPVGGYDANRLPNVGIGHWAIDGGGGYTLLDTRTGLEFSAVVGLTYNFENPSTRYQNGVDSHLDWAASLLLPDGWLIGVAGYGYLQLTGDRGRGAELGSFKSKVVAIGPQVVWQFTVAGQPWSATARAYYEPWSENRLRGWAVFAGLNIPLTGYGK